MGAASRPILVTGAHRSGTTWVGRTLASAPGVEYIHEPFSVDSPPGAGVCSARFSHWFTYVGPENEALYLEPVGRMLAFSYDLSAALRELRSPAQLTEMLAEYRRTRAARRDSRRPLVKDPLALFSAGWLASRFEMEVVVMIRHPAAFASSIMRLGWAHPFDHFLAQPLIMRDLLGPFKDEIERYAREPRDLLDHACLLWRLIHHAVLRFREQHPDWAFLRHEDVARRPIGAFCTLFERLGLELTGAVREFIEEHTRAGNAPEVPVEQFGSIRRHSVAVVRSWKRRLSPAEIERIRVRVADVSRHFHSDADWEPDRDSGGHGAGTSRPGPAPSDSTS